MIQNIWMKQHPSSFKHHDIVLAHSITLFFQCPKTQWGRETNKIQFGLQGDTQMAAAAWAGNAGYRRCKSRTSACLLQLLAATDFSLCWNQPIPMATWPFENRTEENMLCSVSKTWAKNCLQSGGSGYSIIVEPQVIKPGVIKPVSTGQ